MTKRTYRDLARAYYFKHKGDDAPAHESVDRIRRLYRKNGDEFGAYIISWWAGLTPHVCRDCPIIATNCPIVGWEQIKVNTYGCAHKPEGLKCETSI